MIGLDSCAIIDLFRNDPGMKTFLEKNKEPVAASMMSYSEIFFGLDIKMAKHKTEAKHYDRFFDMVFCISLTKEICKDASRIYHELKKQGKIIEENDCIIAASFLRKGITKILTRNEKHFKHIKGLKVVTY